MRDRAAATPPAVAAVSSGVGQEGGSDDCSAHGLFQEMRRRAGVGFRKWTGRLSCDYRRSATFGGTFGSRPADDQPLQCTSDRRPRDHPGSPNLQRWMTTQVSRPPLPQISDASGSRTVASSRTRDRLIRAEGNALDAVSRPTLGQFALELEAVLGSWSGSGGVASGRAEAAASGRLPREDVVAADRLASASHG